MGLIDRLLMGRCRRENAEDAALKLARVDAEIEAQNRRIERLKGEVARNETAAERLVAALTRDRTR